MSDHLPGGGIANSPSLWLDPHRTDGSGPWRKTAEAPEAAPAKAVVSSNRQGWSEPAVYLDWSCFRLKAGDRVYRSYSDQSEWRAATNGVQLEGVFDNRDAAMRAVEALVRARESMG